MNNGMKKKFLIAFVLLLCVFVIYNIIWYIHICIVYKPLEDSVGYDSERELYITFDDENCKYAVFRPDYPTFTGNLSIGEGFDNPSEGDVICNMIIWPSISGKNEFGVSLKKVISVDENGELAFETYSFMFDKNAEPLEELNEEEYQMIENHKDKIECIYRKAYDMWGIGNIK